MPEPFNLHSLLQKNAKLHNSKIAVEDLKGNQITYSELESSSQKIARLLEENNIGEGNRIGILANKSIEYVTSIFGILQSNAAYIPLDCNAPIARNSSIFHDCGMQAVFIGNKFK